MKKKLLVIFALLAINAKGWASTPTNTPTWTPTATPTASPTRTTTPTATPTTSPSPTSTMTPGLSFHDNFAGPAYGAVHAVANTTAVYTFRIEKSGQPSKNFSILLEGWTGKVWGLLGISDSFHPGFGYGKTQTAQAQGVSLIRLHAKTLFPLPGQSVDVYFDAMTFTPTRTVTLTRTPTVTPSNTTTPPTSTPTITVTPNATQTYFALVHAQETHIAATLTASVPTATRTPTPCVTPCP